MDNKQVNKAPQKSARLVLQAVTAIARSNANSLCRGLLYEPKVPTQLKKIRLGGIDYDVKKFKTEDCKSRYWFVLCRMCISFFSSIFSGGILHRLCT
ncbi:MAG: cyclic lactone autoinducer peptide [Agathobacter rectalis]